MRGGEGKSKNAELQNRIKLSCYQLKKKLLPIEVAICKPHCNHKAKTYRKFKKDKEI